MKRVLSFLAWVIALAVLLLTTAPAAISQDAPPGPPGDEPPDDLGGELGWSYPTEWDPDLNADVERAGYIAPGVVLNTVTGDLYDPAFNEVATADGTVYDYATGEIVFQDPFLGSTPPDDPAPPLGFAPQIVPADEPTTGESTDPGPTPAPGITPSADFVDRDPVLGLYTAGFSEADLEAYALDVDALPEGALDDSFQFLSYEIALLFEAGAFTRDTPWFDTFAQVHAQFDLGDAPTDSLVQTLAAVDTEFARRGPLYRPALDPQEDWAVDWAIDELNGPFYELLTRGEFGFLNGFEYGAALLRVMAGGPDIELAADGSAENVQLEVALSGAVRALEIQQDLNELLRTEVDALREQVAALSDPTIATALTVLGGEPAGAASSDGDPLLFGAIAAGAVVMLIGAFLLLRRARRRGDRAGDDTLSRDEAMATNQLLAGAKDEDDIIRILERAGERQVRAPLALFHAQPDGLQPAGDTSILVGSDLQRVVETGQQVKTTLHHDPAFPGDRAVLALPVISGGKVQAVLAAHRPADEPFGATERAAMEPIAPALGGALERVAELGTMSKLAMVDGLTSLGNRRRLDGDLETTLASAVAADAPLGFAMVDVDHFKTFNDTHGHAAGDEVLRRVAATIARTVRETDVVYRYGGEEFSMLLPGATPDEVAQVAERVRATVEAEAFPGEELQPGGRLTVSIGVATLDSGSGEDIRVRADQALYQAKENGRNQVAFA